MTTSGMLVDMYDGLRGSNVAYIPRNASDEQVLSIARHWLEVLAAGNYEAVFETLGHALSYQYDCSGPESIRRAIKAYRSPSLYPGVEEFKVTDWRSAKGGNPSPITQITRYTPNSTGLKGALSIHLPLNGCWSDLEANFVWFESKDPNGNYPLSLEDIVSPAQLQRENEGAP